MGTATVCLISLIMLRYQQVASFGSGAAFGAGRDSSHPCPHRHKQWALASANYLDSISTETSASNNESNAYDTSNTVSHLPASSVASITSYIDMLSSTSTNAAASSQDVSSSPYVEAISEFCVPTKDLNPCVKAVNGYVETSGGNCANYRSLPSIAQNLELEQSAKDVALEAWYSKHGISRGHVRVSTTEKSVGGRGMFWCGTETAAAGQILARIPKKCVLTASSAKLQWQYIEDWSQLNTDANLEIIAAALCAYISDDANGVDWKDWIQSWLGYGGITPHSLLTFSSEEIESLAAAAGTSFAETSTAIEVSHNMFKRDAEKLGISLTDGSMGLTPEEFMDIYCVVMSRCANLGPEWEYERGIVPFHDMHNHPPKSVESSVNLYTLGDVKPHMSNVVDDIEALVKISGNNDLSPPLDDKDILMVASRDVMPGEEIFLAYREPSEMDSSYTGQDRLWIMFQYGFPLIPIPERETESWEIS